MVSKEISVYLFTGQDSFAKDTILAKLKQENLKEDTREFNLDTLYGRELTSNSLQEKLLALPFKSAKRIVVIRNAQQLKEEVKDFLLRYLKKPQPKIILILDMDELNPKDGFLAQISKVAQVCRVQEERPPDAFTLSRQIELKKALPSLRILNQLLENGEKPERILGGLRYAWEKDLTNPIEKRRRLKLLLNCDIDIKTGRLKASFALERFIVNLCAFKNPAR